MENARKAQNLLCRLSNQSKSRVNPSAFVLFQSSFLRSAIPAQVSSFWAIRGTVGVYNPMRFPTSREVNPEPFRFTEEK